MISLVLHMVDAQVNRQPNGMLVLALRDPESGIVVSLPMDERSAETLAANLRAPGLAVERTWPLPDDLKARRADR